MKIKIFPKPVLFSPISHLEEETEQANYYLEVRLLLLLLLFSAPSLLLHCMSTRGTKLV